MAGDMIVGSFNPLHYAMLVNGYGTLVFSALLFTFFLKTAADLMNLGTSGSRLPEEFSDVVDADGYREAQRYLRVTTLFSMFESTFDLLLLFVFWFASGFELLDGFVRGFGFGDVANGVLYIAILVLLQFTASLPFDLYRTFGIEESFGFNRTTPAVFVSDTLKSLLLGIVIGIPLLALLLFFFTSAGSFAWLWAWGFFVLFSLLLQYLAPAWIMPLFNRFKPLGEGELKEAILRYLARTDFPLAGIFVIDGSKRSTKSNAFFTGFGRRKRIALFDTLIDAHSTEELVAVLAHETGHFKKKHQLVSMVLGACNVGVMFFLLSLFMNNRQLFDAFFVSNVSVYGSLVFFMLLYSPVGFLLSILLKMLSRRHEYQADAYAVATCGNGRALADALKKLSVSNLSNLTPHPLYVFLNYFHPPVLDRIRTIRHLSAGGGNRQTANRKPV